MGQTDITPETWDDLEALLLQSDVGAATTETLLDALKDARRPRRDRQGEWTAPGVERRDGQAAGPPQPYDYASRRLLEIIMVVGVNGSGKTTSIAKLCQLYRAHGRKVILAAADTFRAAAIDQLQIWGERAGVPVDRRQPQQRPRRGGL